jgi:transglutaminase-like putative cysteine protease
MRMVSSQGILAVFLMAAASAAAAPADQHVRHFQIRYSATITGISPDAKLVRVWLPYPQSDAWQTIGNASVDAPYRQTLSKDPEYGNSIVYIEGAPPAGGTMNVVMTFDVTRREYVNRPNGPHAPGDADEDARLLQRFRKPDRLVPLDGKIAEVAREATQGRITDRDKARAIYKYVTTHLRYDKSGTGWGRGDAIWACDAKRGNCTDYHSLLIGMARSVGIPAKFEIGLPVPDDKPEGAIGGYHCWAEFYLDGIGWVPVDSSEASKFPEKREYFFGALDTNRVRLSVGRDITLDPRQTGAPVNFFVYPYVEVDGKPFAGVSQSFTFRDLASSAASQDAPRPLNSSMDAFTPKKLTSQSNAPTGRMRISGTR